MVFTMDIIEFLLDKGEVQYIDMIEPLRHGFAEVVEADEHGVLLCIKDAVYLLAVFEQESIKRFVDKLPQGVPVATHQQAVSDFLLQQGRPHFIRTRQAVYMHQEPYQVPSDLVFRPLDSKDLPLVLEHYRLINEQYVTDRLMEGTMIGVEVDGQLAAFIGEHDEGSMGMLEVLPAYRRRGLGFELEKVMCNRLLGQGRKPYCQVEQGNEASLNLQRKLGFSISSVYIDWFN